MTELSLYQAFILSIGSLLIGIVMLVRGGGMTIDSSVFIAKRFGISPMLIGFTVLAFGTSFPELVISILANMQDSAGIALGNVLGSNIANIFLVLAVTALFVPMTIHIDKAIRRDMVAMILATCLLMFFMYVGVISRAAGLLFVALIFAYIYIQYRLSKVENLPFEIEDPGFKDPKKAYAYVFLGLILIAAGAEFLVQGAQVTAELLRVPEDIIGLSIIALGTSLPELSTSIIAGRKGHTDMVVGNIIGSNVFNILMIIGITSIIKPIYTATFSPQLVEFDMWVALIVAITFCIIAFLFGKIGKITASLFIVSYLAYNIFIYASNISTM